MSLFVTCTRNLAPSENRYGYIITETRMKLFHIILLCTTVLLLNNCATNRQYGCGASAEDGRFTIGTGTKRLMYGYPSPHSTSHFILSVNGKFASNNPCVGKGTVTYLYGVQRKWGESGSMFSEIDYDFNGVRITQRLIPVDKSFTDVQPGQFGQYYRIEYTIENISDSATTAGLTLLLDTMIDTNDGAAMEADGTKVTTETKYNTTIPAEILVYKTAGSKSDLVASCVTAKGKAVKPDELYVGRWRYFYPTVWNIEASGEQYGDSGILLKWNEQSIAPRAKRFVATHYGLPQFQNGEIQMKSYDPFVKRATTQVYFDFADDKLSEEAKNNLQQLVGGRTIEGIFCEVYTDAVGKDADNLKLSQRRGESVMRYLQSLQFSRDIMIVKSHGAQFADRTFASTKGGKAEDRRADVTIYIKEERH